MKKFIIFLFATIVLTACHHPQPQNEQTVNDQAKKCLVVFFSHAGDNYVVGNIQTGNTKIVADYICELTGADRFEITTSKYDGLSYHALTKLARQEAEHNVLPPFEGQLASADGSVIASLGDSTFASLSEELADYEIIFIGGPIWWGTFPQVMFSFFDTYDLNGKTIYPFTTHEGSGLGNVVSAIHQAYPKADVKPGFSIYGHEVCTHKTKIRDWIKGLHL